MLPHLPPTWLEPVTYWKHGRPYHYIAPRCLCYSKLLITVCGAKNVFACFREIQQSLVEIGDKDPSFIGSREWIGAIELSFVLDKLIGVSIRRWFIIVFFFFFFDNWKCISPTKLSDPHFSLCPHNCQRVTLLSFRSQKQGFEDYGEFMYRSAAKWLVWDLEMNFLRNVVN